MMRRRKFITLLGGAASAWPLAARAQQPQKLHGCVSSLSIQVPLDSTRFAAFFEGLRDLSYVVGGGGR